MSEECNGWSNSSTWLVHLWIANDESSERRYSAAAQAYYDDALEDGGDEDDAADKLAGEIETDVNGANPLEGQSGIYADMVNNGLSEVDWREIADAFMADVEKPEPEEKEEEEEEEEEEVATEEA